MIWIGPSRNCSTRRSSDGRPRTSTYKIGVDSSQGVAGVKQFSSAVKRELKSIEGDFDDTATAGEKVATVLSKMAAELDTELDRAAQAADALSAALGPELAGRADVGQLVGDLQRMGLTFEEITADADKLAASLKEIDAVQMKGLDSGLGGVKTKFGEMDDSVRGSRSVLANMVGNATQDLGALGGLAGSAGVAIGQMGEYMADATLNGQGLRSVVSDFVKVAGPVAALAIGIGGVSAVMGEMNRKSKEAQERTKAMGDAMKDTADESLAFAEVLREDEEALRDFTAATNDPLGTFGVGVDKLMEKIPLIGGVFNDAEQDIVSAMGRAELSIYDIAKQVEAGGKVGGEFTKQLLDALAAGKITEDEYGAINEKIQEYAVSAADAREMVKLWNVDQAEANALLKELALQADPLSRFGDQWKILMDDMADGAITKEGAAAANFLAEKLGKEVPEVLDIAGQAWDDNKAKVEEWQQATEEAIAESTQFVLDYAEAIQDAALEIAGAEGDMRDLADVFSQMGVKGEALAAIFDLQNAPIDAEAAVRDIEIAIDDLSTAAEGIDLSEGLDPSNVKADALLDAIDGLRPAIQQRVTDAFSAGGPEAAKTLANSYVAQVAKELGVSEVQAAELLGLTDIEALVTVAIEQTSLANAQAQLDILTGLGGETPLTASIALGLQTGELTPEQAQILIQDQLGDAGVDIPAALKVKTTRRELREAYKAVGIDPDVPIGQPLKVVPTGLNAAYTEIEDGPGGKGWPTIEVPVQPVLAGTSTPIPYTPGVGFGPRSVPAAAGLLSATPMAAGVTPMAGPTLPTLMLPVAAPSQATVVQNVSTPISRGRDRRPVRRDQVVDEAMRRNARLMPRNP